MSSTILQKILHGGQGRISLDRSGSATIARLACAAVREGRQAVILAKDRDSFQELHSLARLFMPELSCADYSVADPSWSRPLVLLPEMRSWDDRDAWSARLAALYNLSQGKPCCVIASLQSVLLRYVPRDFFASRYLELCAGMEFSPELVLEQAVEWGYERVQMVTAPGEIASRGDILDIFPAGYAKPVRLDFFGDNIEEIRVFDPESQRSLVNMESLLLLPALPVDLNVKTLMAARQRVEKLAAGGSLDENQAYSLKRRLEEGAGGILPGLFYENISFFEEWLCKEPLWLLPGDSDSVEALLLERVSLKEELEAESNQLQQPAALVLRRKNQPAPWNGAQCVLAEPLRVGVDNSGIDLQERSIHGFSDIFSRPEDKDRPWQALIRGIRKWQSEYEQVIFSFSSDRGRKKFLNLAAQDGILPQTRYAPEQGGLYALVSGFRQGADLLWAKILVLGEDILYPRAERRKRRSSHVFKGLDNFENLKNGDLLVHRDYGIGRFAGLHHMEINSVANDFLLLEYSGHDRLYVPVDRLAVIQRFKGGEGIEPPLDRLGASAWSNGKEKARKAIEKIAADLVEMYAYRKVAKSFSYPQPGELYHEFEATFSYEETPDQSRAIQDVLDDMEKETPMDRLVCGDVGFGKTEVALRAAFRAAAEGRQVALLCPTTVLAEQHFQTFRSRLSGFPINVGLLSRFVPKGKQKETLKACEAGQIDILVGTHRILSSDVKLPNLALLILDEEQRFGVRHKEKLKSLKKNVDVLTLTATPIPRTLQLSISGIRDLSIIETAPADRKPVASAVIDRNEDLLRTILQRELARKGQVFWVYNRVQGIEEVVSYVKRLVPEARVGLAHGQLAEKELETAMRDFWHGELDVLVCTAIVESGLDFPLANTLVVDQAQMFGLGQLYQLRGRVGRSDRQAYAYFVTPDSRRLSELTRERLRIILDMDYLGAGFQVAMEDLRLRGAGNILGEAQSGHISRIGLDMYLEMLEEAVHRLKGLPELDRQEVELNLGLPAHIPATYIDDGRERLRYYKAMTAAENAAAREEIALAMRDRFGHFPVELVNYLAILDLKQLLSSLGVERADINTSHIRLKWRDGQNRAKPEKIVALASTNPQIKLLPPASIDIPLKQDVSFDMAVDEIKKLLETVKAN